MQAAPTREEFLSHAHTPLVNAEDPAPGSPTKSTLRIQWRELRDWDIEADVREYWDAMDAHDRNAPVTAVSPYHWAAVSGQMNMLIQPFMSKSNLREPFSTAYRVGHNAGIIGASDPHAMIWSEGRQSQGGEAPLSNPDFFWVYEGKLAGIIELQPWWKINEAQIGEVRSGINSRSVHG
jgi:hypothetical protein